MFSFFKRKKDEALFTGSFGILKTDMHSHLLPGIDDGAPDVETSIQLIRGLMELGYEKFITTPHIYPDLYPNNRETIFNALELLKQKLQEENMVVDITPAAEYFIDDLFAELVESKEPLLTITKNWVLVEISFIAPPPDLNKTLFNLITNGYQPILAHPERYSYYHNKREIYHRFKDQGCLLQINLLSLTGYYGKSVQDAARYLVKEQLVDLVGTDLHHERHLQAMHNNSLIQEVHAIIEKGQLLNSSL